MKWMFPSRTVSQLFLLILQHLVTPQLGKSHRLINSEVPSQVLKPEVGVFQFFFSEFIPFTYLHLKQQESCSYLSNCQKKKNIPTNIYEYVLYDMLNPRDNKKNNITERVMVSLNHLDVACFKKRNKCRSIFMYIHAQS